MTVWRVRLKDLDGLEQVVAIEADATSSTQEVVTRLHDAGYAECRLTFRGRDLESWPTLGDAGLRHGDLIECDRPDWSPSAVDQDSAPEEVRHRLHLLIVAGIDAGDCTPLADHEICIGRSAQATITIEDPMLSSRHAMLRWDTSQHCFGIEDLGSTNGTKLEGQPLAPEVVHPLLPGAFFQLGGTVCTLVEVDPEAAAIVDHNGEPAAALARRFRNATEPLPARLAPPTPPNLGEPGSTSWWRSLTPLFTGVGFAVMTGRWQFLLIIAMAPIIMTVDSRRQRKRRAAAQAAAEAAHATDVANHRELVATFRNKERNRLRDNAGSAGHAHLFAKQQHRRLWERTADDADFGQLTLGLAALPTTIEAGDTDPAGGRPLIWGTPLTTSLPEEGSVSVIGEQAQCSAVLRSLMLQAAVQHSPSDLSLWVLTSEERARHWEFARWLPHVVAGPRQARLGVDRPGRAQLFGALRQIVDTRRDQQHSSGKADSSQYSRSLPIHLVFIDGLEEAGRDLIVDKDLAELLVRGAEVGVFAVIADEHRSPEGTGSLLRLGPHLDEASFQSRVQPQVTGVAVGQSTIERAQGTAQKLSALRPVQAPGDHDEGSAISLVDLLQLNDADAADILDRWERTTPQTRAVVGKTSDAPMAIDIAAHGPHGLVGGMSGSGKTEFLMTLLTSLCLNNHPDDLGVVIVDFKGGVDHALTSQLPHVVGMSTNLDVDQFSRTIALLDAEQRRRQELLRGVAGDIDAYREARVQDPSLPPLPRLLVIVDEFSELLATDNGKEHLAELISVTRIGRALGVHLLLVTQNFEGQLPPQVDANAGLRVCLRVMKPGHSKVVLDSPLAATIPPSNVGQAYARFNGQDIVAFQTARVAGRRRSLSASRTAVTVQILPLSSLATAQQGRHAPKPPIEETDMAHLIDQLWIAVTKSGWQASAVPWPTELDTDIGLRGLIAEQSEHSDQFPVGMQDCPDRQAHKPLTLSPEDAQLLFLGAPDAGTTPAMVTCAVSAAILRHPDRLHLHGLDLDGSGLSSLRDLPHTGTVAIRDESIGLRLLNKLTEEVAQRRSLLVQRGVTSWQQLPHNEQPPRALLLVTGADRLTRRGDDTRSAMLAPLAGLVAESIGTGVDIWLGGLPSIADSRLGMNVERRFIFKLPGEVNPAAYGAPRAIGSALGSPGRAIDTATDRLVQFACVATETSSRRSVVANLGQRLRERMAEPQGQPPLALTSVAWPHPLGTGVEDAQLGASDDGVCLAVGLEVETAAPAFLDGIEDGPHLIVTGPTKSGRSTTLAMLSRYGRGLGWRTVAVAGSRRSPLLREHAVGFEATCRPEELQRQLEDADGPLLVCIDDLHRFNATDFDETLFDPAMLEARAEDGRPVLFATAGPTDFFDGRSPLRRMLPPSRAGLLLAPTGAHDGAAVGLAGRLDEQLRALPRAGRGLLVLSGEHRMIQVPDLGPGDVSRCP